VPPKSEKAHVGSQAGEQEYDSREEPHLSITAKALRRSARRDGPVKKAFFGVIYLCTFQMILMLCLTFFFLSSKSVASGLFDQIGSLGEYSPLLMKYRRAVAGAKSPFELSIVFSIYFSFVAVQAIVIPAVLVALFKSRPSRIRFHFSRENIFLLVLALLTLISPLWDILVGPSDITNPDVYSNRIFHGDVGWAFVEYCVMVPWFNFVFFVCIYTACRNRP